MKATGTRITAVIVLLIIALCIITVDAQPQARASSSSRTTARDPVMRTVLDVADRDTTVPFSSENLKTRAVRMVDFYLRDGKLVFGKLITEDRNKVTLEQIEGSKIIVATYSKREMETRSLQTKNISASKYYQDMAEYFAGRTWDFKDDPDDFIQAIRFYKRAKGLIEGTSQLDREKAKEIDAKVAELEADRETWTKQVENRAKLKELEFQAEYLKKFEELEAMINASAEKIDKSTAQIDEVLEDVKKNTETLEKNIPAMEQDLRRRMDVLGAEVDANRRMLDPFGRARNYRYNGRRY
jgi:hypothetical protein